MTLLVSCDVVVDVVEEVADDVAEEVTLLAEDDVALLSEDVEEVLLDVEVYFTSSSNFPLCVVQVGI